jgi:hypothetical protein
VLRKRIPPRRAATPAEDRAAVADRRTRALEEPLDVRLRTRDPYPILEVRNPLHGTLYLVLLPEHPERTSSLCTCTDFARRGLGTCKHLEAGVRWLRAHEDTTPLQSVRSGPRSAPVWKEIDRRLASAPGTAGPESLRIRRPGAALFEVAAG